MTLEQRKRVSEGTKVAMSKLDLSGRKASEELKLKLSLVHKGLPSHRKGKSLVDEYGDKAEEIRKKLSMSHTGKYLEQASNWQGGVSFIKYPSEFNNTLKKKIRSREKLCRICGIKEKLDVHHIDYDKYNNSIFNLICLCRKCHIKTNYNRSFWTNLFQRMIYFWYVDRGVIGV